jgi:hypothetical protein
MSVYTLAGPDHGVMLRADQDHLGRADQSQVLLVSVAVDVGPMLANVVERLTRLEDRFLALAMSTEAACETAVIPALLLGETQPLLALSSSGEAAA